MINVLVVPVGGQPYMKEIETSLGSYQKEVGGLIEVAYIGNNKLLILNEEGKINGLDMNRRIGEEHGYPTTDIICGDFFICESGEEDFLSIPPDDIEHLTKLFSEIPSWTEQDYRYMSIFR